MKRPRTENTSSRAEPTGPGAFLADVAILTNSADEAALHTLTQAFEREGWRIAANGEPASRAVVVWSQSSVSDTQLADGARSYLEADKLLQVFPQPREWSDEQTGVVEPPEPFRYYEALKAPFKALDGSDRAIDWFDFSRSEGQKILTELARLGRLPRPCDQWNAEIEFLKPSVSAYGRGVRVDEIAENGR